MDWHYRGGSLEMISKDVYFVKKSILSSPPVFSKHIFPKFVPSFFILIFLIPMCPHIFLCPRGGGWG